MAGFLIIAGLTGSLLAFEPELDAWLNPSLFRVEQVAGPALSPSRIVERIERADPTVAVSSIVLPAAPGESVSLYVGQRPEVEKAPAYNQVFVDPTDGAVLGHRLRGAARLDRAHLMPFLYTLHYSLLLPGIWGSWLMGGVALAWMLDCFVGFYLTLPRGGPFWTKWRPIWRIKRGAGGYRLNLDLHRASGLWLWPVLFLLALSSVALNLNAEVFRPALSALLPTSPSIWDKPAPSVTPPVRIDWDGAVTRARAEARRRGWFDPVSLVYAARDQGFYMVRFGRKHQPGFSDSSIFVSGADGRILSAERAGGGKAGDVVADLMFPIHTGQVAGTPGRILICIAGIVVALLSITGITIWWKKRVAQDMRTRASRLARHKAGATKEVHVPT